MQYIVWINRIYYVHVYKHSNIIGQVQGIMHSLYLYIKCTCTYTCTYHMHVHECIHYTLEFCLLLSRYQIIVMFGYLDNHFKITNHGHYPVDY